MVKAFSALGLTEKTLHALEKKGFQSPSPIQAQVIPLLLQGKRNIIGQAATGTGKTAAFGIPLIEKLLPTGKPQALILTPTRELANQVAEEIASFQSTRALKIVAIYGGQSYGLQIAALKRGADIIVGTPGRIIDHLDRGKLDLSQISNFILDEADEMLNMGFIDDIEAIFKKANPEKNVLLFSATMPKEILRVAKKYMGEYELIAVKNQQMTTAQTSQIYFEVNEQDKFHALCRIIDVESDFYGIIFCKTKLDVDYLTKQLLEKGYQAQGLHGDVIQKQRENILSQFKEKTIKILIATDVAARGIDVNDVSHVINYALPQDIESYVHRVGRTGRAGKTGIAISFVSPQEYKKLISLQKITKTDIQKAQIPTPELIVQKRKEQLLEDVQAILAGKKYLEYSPLVEELLKQHPAEAVIAALLRLNYEESFNPAAYQDIGEVKLDFAGKTRLFIALGRKAGYSPRGLVDFLVAEAGVKSRDIDDVRVMDDFSFVTLPYLEAEHVLHTFKTQKVKGKSLITKAKAPRTSPGSSRGSRSSSPVSASRSKSASRTRRK
ncbi:MAG: ATP-dependent helicase [candidate division SR1 bacterium]|nr:MAG: ATP-dependent helicase [candidate division SR1 bacterium]